MNGGLHGGSADLALGAGGRLCGVSTGLASGFSRHDLVLKRGPMVVQLLGLLRKAWMQGGRIMPITTPLPPPTAQTLPALYNHVFRPLFFPAPEDFTQPLLDSFVAAHDELLDSTTLSDVPAHLRELGVNVDTVVRQLQRQVDVAAQPLEDGLSLEEVGKLRLRSRLQSQAGPNPASRQDVLTKSRERMDAFEREMKEAEQKALQEFKEGLRRAVASV